MLAAMELRLGTCCWIGTLDEEQVREVLGVPEDIRVVAFTPVGYTEEKKDGVFASKSLREITSINRFGQVESQGFLATVGGTLGKLYIKSRIYKDKMKGKFTF